MIDFYNRKRNFDSEGVQELNRGVGEPKDNKVATKNRFDVMIKTAKRQFHDDRDAIKKSMPDYYERMQK